MSGTSSLKEFSFKDLKIATRNFSPDSLLGEGGFGRVYEGWVDEKTLAPSTSGIGMAVAVKIFNPTKMQGFQEWQSEVNFLGRHYHPNVIDLFGYCWEDEKLVLVYEFMNKGSLKKHLFKNFSLVTFGPANEDAHISTNIIGTYGYADPEYTATGHLCIKSDVYGYGVVLLKLLTGLRAVDINRPREQQNLVDWLKPMLSRRNMLKIIMDERMDGQYSFEAAFQAAQLSLNCLELDPQRRPSMRKVVEVLKEIEALKDETKESLPNLTPHSTTYHHGHPFT